MLKRRRRWGEAGSGMVIGVAIMFPMLVTVIMVLQVVADASRIEQSLQATANRTARAASLCCLNTNGAEAVAKAGIEAAQVDNAYNRVRCNNDLARDSTVVFEDIDGSIITAGPDTAVPPGGTVSVFLTCSVPPEILGAFVLPLFDAKRTVVGTATIDPFRHRTAT